MAPYRISELAERTGTPPSTLRFYDRAGLLPAQRSPSGYRLYGDSAVEQLAFIASGKQLGLPLADIRGLLAVWADGLCGDVRGHLRPLLAARIAGAEQQAAALAAATARLREALAELDGPASPGRCAPGCGCWQHQQDRPGDPAGQAASRGGDGTPGPEIACTLAAAEQADRIGQWRRLLARAARREAVAGGVRIHLPAAAAGPAAELAAAEQQCCAFLSFTLHLAGPGLVLEVRAPAAAMPVLAGLFGAGPMTTASASIPPV